MDKNRVYPISLLSFREICLLALLLLFFLAGCVGNATPGIEPAKVTDLATPKVESSPVIVPGMPITPSAGPTMTNVSGGGVTKSAPHVSPYIKVTVTDVEIRYLETKPVQVELVIRGTLPDQCKYDFYSIENRNEQKIKVSLSGIHPADTSCPQTVQNIEYVLRLGQDLPESERGFLPGDYTFTVNNYQGSFSIK